MQKRAEVLCMPNMLLLLLLLTAQQLKLLNVICFPQQCLAKAADRTRRMCPLMCCSAVLLAHEGNRKFSAARYMIPLKSVLLHASCAVPCCAVHRLAYAWHVPGTGVRHRLTVQQHPRTMKLNTLTSFTVPLGYIAGALQQHAAVCYWVCCCCCVWV